jgi:hypothetical protein
MINHPVIDDISSRDRSVGFYRQLDSCDVRFRRLIGCLRDMLHVFLYFPEAVVLGR